MKTFYLELIAIDRKFYTGPCESVVLPTVDGEYGILAGHEPVVLALYAGALTYTVDGKKEVVAVGDGFADVTGKQVTVLTDFIERPDEIDVACSKEAKRNAEEKIKCQHDCKVLAHAQDELSQAEARIKVATKEKR